MSIISFIKEAGEKLFGHRDSAPAAPAADPAALQAKAADADKTAAAAIEKYIASQNLSADGLTVEYDGSQQAVTVSGVAPDQATKEKIVLCCGNVQGVAKVNDMLTVEQPADESRYYTVVKGDTLSAIAKKEYGNANAYMKIFEANKPMLSNPDKIYPGQLLRIPAPDRSTRPRPRDAAGRGPPGRAFGFAAARAHRTVGAESAPTAPDARLPPCVPRRQPRRRAEAHRADAGAAPHEREGQAVSGWSTRTPAPAATRSKAATRRRRASTSRASPGCGSATTCLPPSPTTSSWCAVQSGWPADAIPRLAALAQMVLRAQDQLRLFELHPTDHRILASYLGPLKGAEVFDSDGFDGLKGQVPPSTRRAVVLMDPSYEGNGDYAKVVGALRDASRASPRASTWSGIRRSRSSRRRSCRGASKRSRRKAGCMRG
jgi:LysM repeat protein